MSESNPNLELYNKVRVVPDEAKKPIKGGRLKGMTDINPMWRIKMLTEEFGPCGIGWYYKPVKKWPEIVGDEIAVFVDVELYIKIDGEWSMPIYGNGGSKLSTRESGGVYVSDECYKMATTDALSVACKQLGIGADVYYGADKTKYDKEEERKINKEELEKICKQLERTGTSERNIIYTYSPKSLDNLTYTQYADAIKRLEKMPDYVPPEIPESIDEEAPFR